MAKKLDRPRKVRTSLEELEVLERLKDTVEWAIVKRIANRYISNLRRKAFNISEAHPRFKEEHIDYTGQARGIKQLIKVVDQSGKKKEKMEEGGYYAIR